jgi:hypothetical protein
MDSLGTIPFANQLKLAGNIFQAGNTSNALATALSGIQKNLKLQPTFSGQSLVPTISPSANTDI